jgi:hypothetical protein
MTVLQNLHTAAGSVSVRLEACEIKFVKYKPLFISFLYGNAARFSRYVMLKEAGIAQSVQWLCYGLDVCEIGVPFPGGVRELFFHQEAPVGSGAYRASC